MASLPKRENMKTLDEIIKVFTKCFDNTYNIVPLECEPEYGEDALQYLKWYKDLADNSEAFTEWKENPPLTWNELRTMEEKPVWIEFLNDEGNWNGEWCLVESSNNILCEILRCKTSWFGLRKITLGKTWQAYRKEKNEDVAC